MQKEPNLSTVISEGFLSELRGTKELRRVSQDDVPECIGGKKKAVQLLNETDLARELLKASTEMQSRVGPAAFRMEKIRAAPLSDDVHAKLLQELHLRLRAKEGSAGTSKLQSGEQPRLQFQFDRIIASNNNLQKLLQEIKRAPNNVKLRQVEIDGFYVIDSTVSQKRVWF